MFGKRRCSLARSFGRGGEGRGTMGKEKLSVVLCICNSHTQPTKAGGLHQLQLLLTGTTDYDPQETQTTGLKRSIGG